MAEDAKKPSLFLTTRDKTGDKTEDRFSALYNFSLDLMMLAVQLQGSVAMLAIHARVPGKERSELDETVEEIGHRLDGLLAELKTMSAELNLG